MEKINISELLKDCPTGYPLDCTMYEDVYFDFVDELNIIHCYIQYETHKTSITFNQHGTPHNDIKSKCVIFPKGKTTWEGFHRPFKDGDVLYIHSGRTWICIYKEGGETANVYYKHVATNFSNLVYDDIPLCHREYVKEIRFATEEEKRKLFNAIKANGYRWNAETKTLETLIKPKFKIGDKVRHRGNYSVVFTITSIEEDYYGCGAAKAFWFANQDDYELVPNKFDINTLKPFDKVLVRDKNTEEWRAHFFSHYRNTSDRPYICIGIEGLNEFKKCIPFKGNEHLRGKTDNCNDFYKTW
jgi:hypothetical protein